LFSAFLLVLSDDKELKNTLTGRHDEDDVTYCCCRLRHDNNGGAWCPKHMVTREALEYLEVNLHTMHVVVAVQTQGRFGNGMGREYAEVYMLEYWRPGFSSNMWARWKDRSGKEVSPGGATSVARDISFGVDQGCTTQRPILLCRL
jgi:discoidin domain receptor family protein 2